MSNPLHRLESMTLTTQMQRYKETLEWVRLELLQKDPTQLGYIASKIDDVLATSRAHQQTSQETLSVHVVTP